MTGFHIFVILSATLFLYQFSLWILKQQNGKMKQLTVVATNGPKSSSHDERVQSSILTWWPLEPTSHWKVCEENWRYWSWSDRWFRRQKSDTYIMAIIMHDDYLSSRWQAQDSACTYLPSSRVKTVNYYFLDCLIIAWHSKIRPADERWWHVNWRTEFEVMPEYRIVRYLLVDTCCTKLQVKLKIQRVGGSTG